MANKPPANNPASARTKAESPSLIEKYLAIGFVGSVLVSVVAILVILLSPLLSKTWVPSGWGMIPILVMPFGVLCLIALLVASAIRRNKSSRNQ
jgi:hypothetical protein